MPSDEETKTRTSMILWEHKWWKKQPNIEAMNVTKLKKKKWKLATERKKRRKRKRKKRNKKE